MDKQFVLNNIDAALLAIHAVPDDQINLARYAVQHECGTHYCLAGVLTNQPHFQALGWVWDGFGEDMEPWVKGSFVAFALGALQAQLGPDTFGRLFAKRDWGDLDAQIFASQQGHITDKDLAICRLVEQRKLVEAM